MDPTTIFVLILTGVVFGGAPTAGSWSHHELPSTTVQSTSGGGSEVAQAVPVLIARPMTYAFGSVPIYGGTVSTRYVVTNVAGLPVRLRGVYTSCGCTTAELRFSDGVVAGPFGMPGHELPVRYDRVLQSGESFEVVARFNPATHGLEGLGNVVRSIILEPVGHSPLELTFSATVRFDPEAT